MFLFGVIYAIPFIYVFMPEPPCTDYCGFMESLEVREFKSLSPWFFFFMIALNILGPVHFYVNARVSFYISTKTKTPFLGDEFESH